MRQGSCLGSDGFGEKLMDRVGKMIAGRKRGSYRGAELRRHDEKEAGKILANGLRILGVKERSPEARACLADEKLYDCRQRMDMRTIKHGRSEQRKPGGGGVSRAHRPHAQTSQAQIARMQGPEWRELKRILICQKCFALSGLDP